MLLFTQPALILRRCQSSAIIRVHVGATEPLCSIGCITELKKEVTASRRHKRQHVLSCSVGLDETAGCLID